MALRWGVSACQSGLGWSVGDTKNLGRIGGVSPFLRKVKTASGATAVQIVEKKAGQRRILEHPGSAHDEAQLAALIQIGRDKLHANQPALDFDDRSGDRPRAIGAVVEDSVSQRLVEVIRHRSGDRRGCTVGLVSRWSPSLRSRIRLAGRDQSHPGVIR